MDVSRQPDLRRNQKERTRAAIVDAALALMREGVTPTVATAAEAAKVSRPTAYRYFPTRESLLSEVMAVTPSVESVEAALRTMDSPDPRERLGELLDRINRILVEDEGRYRAAMRIYLDTWFAAREAGQASPRVRAGRRRRWLEQVLAPLRGTLPPDALNRLQHALSLTIGIDSIAVLKDVNGLDNEETLAVLRWTALTLLDAVLRETTASTPVVGATTPGAAPRLPLPRAGEGVAG